MAVMYQALIWDPIENWRFFLKMNNEMNEFGVIGGKVNWHTREQRDTCSYVTHNSICIAVSIENSRERTIIYTQITVNHYKKCLFDNVLKLLCNLLDMAA